MVVTFVLARTLFTDYATSSLDFKISMMLITFLPDEEAAETDVHVVTAQYKTKLTKAPNRSL